MKRALKVSGFLLAAFGVLTSPLHAEAGEGNAYGNDPVLYWNSIAQKSVVEDHSGTYGDPEQGGPTRTSYALAIVHIAIYDAVNAIDGSHEPYITVTQDAEGAGVSAAVAEAAFETLAALYPSQAEDLKKVRDRALAEAPKEGREHGVRIGFEAAMNILTARMDDNSDRENEIVYPPKGLVSDHVADPLNPDQGLLGPGWGLVETFSGINVEDVRTDDPPALESDAYYDAFVDVAMLGGDGLITPTLRTKEETEIGLFWGYDGSNGIGVPPVMYNQTTQTIAKQQHNRVVDNARLFALVNIALADAGIAAWDSKYYHNLWRPIVAIRNADPENADWTPLGAPASNVSGKNFTPPFPAYPSGHATFGAALFRTLEKFYGTDDISFSLKSDEMRGYTTDSEGKHRYTTVRRFDSFSQAAFENGRSRIYLGIHWQFDADAGIKQGATIADEVFGNLLLKRAE